VTSTVQSSSKISGLPGRAESGALSSAVLLRLGSARKKGKTKTGLLACVLLTVMIFTVACGGGGSSSGSGGTGGGGGGGGGGGSTDCSSGASGPSGGTFTFEVLHDLGEQTSTGVVIDAAGNIYGTAGNLVYKLDPAGNELVLTNLTDISVELSNLILDADGNLYGNSYRTYSGFVFKIDPAGNLTELYNFTGGADGGGPVAGVVRDAAGNLYGTTTEGGDLNCGFTGGCGVVFKLDVNGQETVLYTVHSPLEMFVPTGNLVLDRAGNLYGTTGYGGVSEFGTVFKVDPAGTYTVLHAFTGGSDGVGPSGALVQDAACNLYGATLGGGGGAACLDGCGTLFKVDPTGKETVLYSFTGADGSDPQGPLALDGSGNLYGTTVQGGLSGLGVVFKLDPSGNETLLHAFTGLDGAYPNGISIDSEGNLYGTTFSGGKVFKLTRSP